MTEPVTEEIPILVQPAVAVDGGIGEYVALFTWQHHFQCLFFEERGELTAFTTRMMDQGVTVRPYRLIEVV